MIDVLNLPNGDIFKVCPEIKDIPCFVKFDKESGGLPVREAIIYTILLYTKDSFLNKKPMEPLPTRRVKAAKLAGLDPEKPTIQNDIFNMDSREFDSLVVDFLIYQSSSQWSHRCAVETQMDENLRIRFKPIESEKGDKDIIEASTKKFMLTEHYSKYNDIVKKLDNEIFLDHEGVRDSAVRKRTSLESLIK